MKTFRDNLGRRWCIRITVDAVNTLLDWTGIDLLNLGNREYNAAIFGDPVMIAQAVYFLCGAHSRSLDEEEFAATLSADVLESAGMALVEALKDFYPPPPEQAEPAPPPTTLQGDEIRANVYRLAGALGVDPGPLTIRQLKMMVDGRNAAVWDVASWIGHVIFTAAPMRKGKAPTPKELNPMQNKKSGKPDVSVPFSCIIGAMTGVNIYTPEKMAEMMMQSGLPDAGLPA